MCTTITRILIIIHLFTNFKPEESFTAEYYILDPWRNTIIIDLNIHVQTSISIFQFIIGTTHDKQY